jgi:predicted DNA-binding transcriptional regulator YafY
MGNLERIVFIDSKLRAGDGFRLADIVERFEVSERQAKRDIEFLRYRLDAPLEWDASKRSYRYTEEFSGLDFADEKALLFYVFARAAAGTLAYVPLAEAGALERLRELVPRQLRGLEKALRYELPNFEPINAESLALFLTAIKKGEAISALYRDAAGLEEPRTIVPRRLVNYGGTWYCIAYDPSHRQLRTWKLSRFGPLRVVAAEEGRGPDEAELDSFLDRSYGMFKGDGAELARLRFRGRAREIVRGEIWHPEQLAAERDDGSGRTCLDLEVPVSRWEEILGRVLRFGAEGEVLGPAIFREKWLAEIEAMAEVARRARGSDTTPQT